MSGIQCYGPFEFTSNDLKYNKLFSFCNHKLSNLSKKKLRECFKLCYVYLNNKQLVNQTNDECLRLQVGDVITIRRDLEIMENIELASIQVEVLYVNRYFAVVLKPSGISAGYDSLFNKSVSRTLNNEFSSSNIVYKPLYYLQRGLSGLLLYPVSNAIFSQNIKLTYRCLVSGKFDIGIEEIGQFVDSSYNLKFEVKVKSVTRSTFANYLSLIDVHPILEYEKCDCDDEIDDKQYINIQQYISQCIKRLRKSLSSINHPIVGDCFTLKKKGLHASLIGIEIPMNNSKPTESTDDSESTDCTDNDNRIKIQHDNNIMKFFSQEPPKLQKLIMREQMYYDKSLANKINTLTARSDLTQSSFHSDISDANDSSVASSDLFNCVVDDSVHAKDDSLNYEDLDMPVEYLTNEAYFYGNKFVVTPDVMIPKKSSESIVKEAMNVYSSSMTSYASVNVLDIGTGSGCLLLSILKAITSMPTTAHQIIRGLGIDISNEALQIAKQNSVLLQVSDFCDFQHLSFDNLSQLLNHHGNESCCDAGNVDKSVNRVNSNPQFQGFDLIVCNPPYSSAKESNRISVSSKKYEPKLALFSMDDSPFSSYKAVANSLADCFPSKLVDESSDQINKWLLRDNGIIIFEVGHGQYERVKEIILSRLSKNLRFLSNSYDHKGLLRCLLFQNISS